MLSFLRLAALITLLLMVAAGWLYFHQNTVNVADGFESPALSNIWTRENMVPNAFEIQSAITRSGKYAAKITLHTGDKKEDSAAGNKTSERDELVEAMPLFAVEGKGYEYHFSLFLPDSFPVTHTRLVLAQWKQFCRFCSCSTFSPILAVRYVSGKLCVTTNIRARRDTLFIQEREFRNQWLDFRFRVKFTHQQDGYVIAFLNNQKIIQYTGITSYPDNCRVLSAQNKYYFKMGLYRDKLPMDMSVYLDEYSKKEITGPED